MEEYLSDCTRNVVDNLIITCEDEILNNTTTINTSSY